jgi:ribosome-binding protein aMBF1 (putative translation factor)
MNTKLNNMEHIKQAFDELFNNRTPEQELESDAKLIMFRFLDIVERKREKLDWSRKELAKKVGTSASYITQLMRGDKLINMLTLAKMQKALNIKFDVSEIVSYQEQTEDIKPPVADVKGFWVYKKLESPNYDKKGNIPEVKPTEEVAA